MKAVPQVTGTTVFAIVATLNAERISSTVISSPPKNFSINSSLVSTTDSNIYCLASSAASFMLSLTSLTSKTCPLSESAPQTISFISIKSTIPSNWSSAPIGNWIGTGFEPNFSRMSDTHISKLAPILSILLKNAILGTWYLSACLQTVSDCGCTPSTAENTATAPSSTLNDLSTSTVKSTCPGVSIMLTLCSRQKHVVAADVIVIPLSCSCSIQSIVAWPSWTSPIFLSTPVKNKILSVVVVFPASMWAMIPTFLVISSDTFLAIKYFLLDFQTRSYSVRKLCLLLPFYKYLLSS